jgi:hypothetical protein
MVYERGRYVVTCNGEIDDFRALRRGLAGGLPRRLKLGPRVGKVAARQAATSLPSPGTLHKPKARFSAPVNAQFGWTEDNDDEHFASAARGGYFEAAGQQPRSAR